MSERLDKYTTEARTIRDAINRRPLTDFYRLEKSRGGEYVCPICGSGTHKNKSGALSISRDARPRVTCFAKKCFGEKGQDTLGALRQLMPEKSEREIFAHCGYQMTGTSRPRAATVIEAGDEPRETRQHSDSEPAHSFAEDVPHKNPVTATFTGFFLS